jgi:alkylhydroperoxidase family enzyme
VIADPRAVATRWPDPRARVLAELACTVTETPWALTPDHRTRAHAVGLVDAEIVHAIALSAYFGHLNRIADAVAMPLDYAVAHMPPPAEPATPAYDRPPRVVRGTPALDLADRPATADAFAAWRAYVVGREPAGSALEAWVAGLVGDGDPVAPPADPTYDLVERVTLAPWQLADATFAPLRARGHDDAALFRIISAASSFGTFARTRVALIALAG